MSSALRHAERTRSAERASLGELAGEVALVTGASSGIGAATARELARRGASVVLAGRQATELEAHARDISEAGGEALAIPADLTDPADVMSLIRQALACYGRVDMLVNNAGAGWFRPLACSPLGEISGLVGVNLLAAMCLTRGVLPGMLERRHGAIISVGSFSGSVAMEPLYSATKYGLRGFSLALHHQLAGSGVSVSLVSPGKIDTTMSRQAVSRMPRPDVVATTIADLVRHPHREIVLPRKHYHYLIAWLEQAGPSVADLVHQRRRWPRVRKEKAVTWMS